MITRKVLGCVKLPEELRLNLRHYVANFILFFSRNGGKRWAKRLYSHPVSGGVDYIIANLKAGVDSEVVDRFSSDHMMCKMRGKIAEYDKCEGESKSPEPAGYDWPFNISRTKYGESPGETISRIVDQLANMDVVMNKIGWI